MKTAILILLATVALGVAAEKPMTLRDCLLYAREHADANRLARMATRQGEARARLALSDMLPTADLYASGNLSFGRNIDPGTNTYDTRRTLSTSFGVEMRVPLFDGLVSLHGLRAAQASARSLLQRELAEQDRISLEVVRAFYNVSYCQAMTGQAAEELERDSLQLLATRRGYELGSKSGADVAELEATVAADEYALTDRRNKLAEAWLDLRSTMGMEPESTPLLLRDDETTDSSTPMRGELPQETEARLDVRRGELELKGAKGAFSPRISLTAGVTTSYYTFTGDGGTLPGFGRQWRDNMGQYIGVSVGIPLFDGLAGVNRVRLARASLAESRLRLEQTRRETATERARAMLAASSAEEEYAAAKRRLEAEEEAYRMTTRRYELGSASAVELHTSGARLATARATLEGKRIQKIINSIVLDYYNGHPLIKE